MLTYILDTLDFIDDTVWTYFGVPAIVILGIYFAWASRLFQLRQFPSIVRLFTRLIGGKKDSSNGLHPIKVFFASIGGCIGIGNVVGVCTAVQIGGPGALVWLWITGFLGMLLKYSEIYLGMRSRIYVSKKGYSGGPMYYLPQAFRAGWIPKFVCALLCVYGVEVYMFRVITESISVNMALPSWQVAGVLLPLVLLGGLGGVNRVGNICTAIIPFFLTIFCGMSLYVLAVNIQQVPSALIEVFRSAFHGHAPIGAFAGAGVMVTISQGVRRACYTGDIGIGYASIIHAESNVQDPEKQAALGIFGIFIDTFIVCTFSLVLIIVTGVWSQPVDATLLIQNVLNDYFPLVPAFMSLFIFLLGYSSMIAFLCVGRKAAEFLSPNWGFAAYMVYAALALVASMFIDTNSTLAIMSVSGALLLVINLAGLFKLRKQVEFTDI